MYAFQCENSQTHGAFVRDVQKNQGVNAGKTKEQPQVDAPIF
jgi:hypothetical protein